MTSYKFEEKAISYFCEIDPQRIYQLTALCRRMLRVRSIHLFVIYISSCMFCLL